MIYSLLSLAFAFIAILPIVSAQSASYFQRLNTRSDVVKPKVLIISMFEPEADVWYNIPEFNVLANNITVPGISFLYPDVHCTADEDICQITIGQAEINAAATVTALVLSPLFDLTTTYFLVAGTAGINPEVATIGSVTFARYGVSVEMQYEISPKDLPNNFSGGYIPQGAYTPQEYPASIYGTEAFEYNQDLQHWAAELARAVPLNDSNTAQEYRANYASTPAYAAGAAPPAIYECDVSTSDIYFSGTSLATGFGAYMKLVTNGSAVYCTTEQETTATSESLLRGALINKLDYSRLIVMFAGSDFDRPYAGEAATTNLFWADQGALDPATTNLYKVGMVLIQNILQEWETKFEAGIKATNYVGDIFGTLGGTPDFGPSNYNDNPIKRNTRRRRQD